MDAPTQRALLANCAICGQAVLWDRVPDEGWPLCIPCEDFVLASILDEESDAGS